MTREQAAMLAAALSDRYPGARVRATPHPGGVLVEMSGAGRLTASIGDGRPTLLSALLFGAVSPPD